MKIVAVNWTLMLLGLLATSATVAAAKPCRRLCRQALRRCVLVVRGAGTPPYRTTRHDGRRTIDGE